MGNGCLKCLRVTWQKSLVMRGLGLGKLWVPSEGERNERENAGGDGKGARAQGG